MSEYCETCGGEGIVSIPTELNRGLRDELCARCCGAGWSKKSLTTIPSPSRSQLKYAMKMALEAIKQPFGKKKT